MVLARQGHGPLQLSFVPDHADPDAASQGHRLDKTRKADGRRDLSCRAVRILLPFLPPDGHVPGGGQSRGLEHPFHDVFIHSDGRAGHPGTDVSRASQLEKTLDCAIFPHGAMEDGYENVHLGAEPALIEEVKPPLRGNGQESNSLAVLPPALIPRPSAGRAKPPLAVFGDADGHNFVSLPIQVGQHRGGGLQGYLMLPRAPAKQHCHPQFIRQPRLLLAIAFCRYYMFRGKD